MEGAMVIKQRTFVGLMLVICLALAGCSLFDSAGGETTVPPVDEKEDGLGPELILNGGFENIDERYTGGLQRSSPAHWQHYKVPQGWGWTNEEAHTGELSMVLVPKPTDSEGGNFYQNTVPRE